MVTIIMGIAVVLTVWYIVWRFYPTVVAIIIAIKNAIVIANKGNKNGSTT